MANPIEKIKQAQRLAQLEKEVEKENLQPDGGETPTVKEYNKKLAEEEKEFEKAKKKMKKESKAGVKPEKELKKRPSKKTASSSGPIDRRLRAQATYDETKAAAANTFSNVARGIFHLGGKAEDAVNEAKKELEPAAKKARWNAHVFGITSPLSPNNRIK